MAVSHLECKECKAQYAAEALYVCERCFGPLEVAYARQPGARDVSELRRRIQGGPQNIWRYADFLPLAGGPPGPSGRLASRVGLPAGCTPLIRADRLAERLGWEIPDRCVVPVASGSLFTKIAKGFEEWLALGLLGGALPRMHGAQAQGCAPVAEAFGSGKEVCRPVRPNTIAKSLAIGNPADGPYALDLARRTQGSVDAVDDDEIREGIALLAETTGISTEPAGGVSTAVLRKLAERGEIAADERVVLVITGEGLKTLDAVRGAFQTYAIAPTLDAFTAAVPEPV